MNSETVEDEGLENFFGKSYWTDVSLPEAIGPAKELGLEEDGSLESGSVLVLMNHSHNSIVRGRTEALNVDSIPEHFPVIRRSDGGGSWYHSNESRCMDVKISKQELEDTIIEEYDEKSHQYVQSAWGEFIENRLEEFGVEANYSAGDVYDRDGKQLVGLSTDATKEYIELRACWYEDEPEIKELLEADGQEDVEDRLKPVNGEDGESFYEHLKENYGPEEAYVESSDGWKDITGDPDGHLRDPEPCI